MLGRPLLDEDPEELEIQHLKTFDDADELLKAVTDSYLVSLRLQLREMKRRLQEDIQKGYIDHDKFNKIADSFYQLIDATIKCDFNRIRQTNVILTRECNYKTKVLTRYTLIGALVGGFLVALGLSIAVVSHGVALPLGAWLANIGSGMLLGGFIGSRYREFKTKNTIAKITRTACNHLEAKDVIQPFSICKLIKTKLGLFRAPAAPKPQNPAVISKPRELILNL